MPGDKYGFKEWAPDYDAQVAKASPTDDWMFGGYDRVLNKVVEYCHLPENSYYSLLDIGIGTGNLAARFLSNDMQIFGIDPSKDMLKICCNKFPTIEAMEGDFLHYPNALEKVDVIVSAYAFHHLTPKEKTEAISLMKDLLKPRGRIIIADFMYQNTAAIDSTNQIIQKKYHSDMAAKFKHEYPGLYDDLVVEFTQAGFKVTGEQLTVSVWLLCATSDTPSR
jgi:putative AdoMet-dependent methyltransferase